MKRASTGLLATTLTLGALLLTACAPAEQPQGQRNDTSRTITATGQGEVMAQPDQVRFVVGITSEGEDSDTVLEANSRQMETLLEALREAGAEDRGQLRTLGVRVHPVWASRPRDAEDDWQPRIRGYQARNQLEVTSRDLEGVGLLLAAAGRAGANEIQGLQFTLEDDAEARDEAIAIATRQALAQARSAAAAADGQTGKVLTLDLDGSRHSPMLQRASSDARMELAAVPVEPGEIRIQAQVSARVELID